MFAGVGRPHSVGQRGRTLFLIRPGMSLPDGFYWIKAHQYEKGSPTALALGDVQVARLLDRLDGTWFVRLYCHHGINGPLVTRDCTSFEHGIRGIEAWAKRHEATLRQEVAEVAGKRRRDKV